MYEKAIDILTDWMSQHTGLAGTTDDEFQSVNIARLRLSQLQQGGVLPGQGLLDIDGTYGVKMLVAMPSQHDKTVPGDIYDSMSKCTGEVLFGFCLIDMRTGTVPEDCSDWLDSPEDAMLEYQDIVNNDGAEPEKCGLDSLAGHPYRLGHDKSGFELVLFDQEGDEIWRRKSGSMDTVISDAARYLKRLEG